jgi:outer membrane biosynthesis protein TonB
MKATTAMDFRIERSDGGRPMPTNRGIVLGIAVSLLLHGALIYLWRHVQPSAPPDTAPRVESIAVWIRPLAAKPPPPPVEVVKPKREPKPISKPKPTTAREKPSAATAPASSPQAITVVTASPATPAASPDALTQETPKFDMEAAKRTARKMAGERDPSKVGTAVGQIPDKPLQTETQLARDIAQGKRGDCRTAYAGAGLLAPVLMLLDKKDSGCKW